MKTLNYLFIGYVSLFIILLAIVFAGRHWDFLNFKQRDGIGSFIMLLSMGFIITGGLQVITAIYSFITTKSKSWLPYFILVVLWVVLLLFLQSELTSPDLFEIVVVALPLVCYIVYIITVFKLHKK